MRFRFSGKSPLGFLFAHSRREDHLARYVLREYRRGRALGEILEDSYLLAWSTPAERGRLLERPDVVNAIGEHSAADLKRALARGGGA